MTVKRKDVSGHAASKKTGGDEKRVKSKHDSMDGSKKYEIRILCLYFLWFVCCDRVIFMAVNCGS